jgi:hypothetical protein
VAASNDYPLCSRSQQQVVTSLSIAGVATIVTAHSVAHGNAARAAFTEARDHPASVSGHGTAARLTHEWGAAMNAAAVAAFGDTFRVVIAIAAGGAVLGLTLCRPPAIPAAITDEVEETSEAPGGLQAGRPRKPLGPGRR